MKSRISVLHLDTERGWRGGQQQAVYLFEYLLKQNYKTHFICRKNSKLADYFRKKAYPFHSLPLRNELDFVSAWKIAKFCRKNDYKILHLHSAHALALGILAKFFYRSLKLIGVRRVDFKIKKNIFSRFKYKSKFVDVLVAISENIKQVLIADGVVSKKIKVIRSGIDVHKFAELKLKSSFRKELNLPENSLIIGTVAAIVGHKDYSNLLKAAEIVINSRENVVFIAAGSGDKEKEVFALAKQLKLKKRFKFLGYRNDVGQLLKLMDIFVLASKLEGLGTSVLDAMSVGLPIVGTNAGGIPEMIENKVNGLVVPKQDPQALATALTKFIDDRDLRKKISQNCKKKVKQFDVFLTAKKNIELYRQLI